MRRVYLDHAATTPVDPEVAELMAQVLREVPGALDVPATPRRRLRIRPGKAEDVDEIERENAIAGVRALMGATNPADALPGTMRGDLATELSENVVHGSDSRASARRELALFFSDGFV